MSMCQKTSMGKLDKMHMVLEIHNTQEEENGYIWAILPMILHFIYGIHFCMFESDLYIGSSAIT